MSMTLKQINKSESGYFCEYGYWHSNMPNAETIAAMEESEQILRDPNSKSFNNVADLIADLLSNDDDEISN